MKKETLTVETDEDGIVRYFNADGNLHNPHGPAMVWVNGDKSYYINGKLHNANGPAVVYADGGKSYFINDQRHNPNGPAVVHADGRKWHYINGKLHNENGPAIVWTDGSKSYFINGKELTEAEFKTWQTEQSAPLHNKTATIDGIEYKLTAK
tara:strand:- start:322 stop:777 length:456 start_codon:yes stop_codon:yes gene_type:complete